MENDVELVDSQETTTDGGETVNPPKEDVEALKARLAKAEGHLSDLKKEHNVSSVKELREKLSKKEEKEPEGLDEIRLRLDGHDADEINLISTMAKGLGKKPGEALSDPLVKSALEGMRIERKSKQAIPEPTTRVQVVDGKSFSELSKPEQKKNYNSTIETLVNKARNKSKTLT